MRHQLWKDYSPSFIPEVQCRQEELWRKWSVNSVSHPSPGLAFYFCIVSQPRIYRFVTLACKEKGMLFFSKSLGFVTSWILIKKGKKMESKRLNWNDSVDCNMECFYIFIIFWKLFMIGHGSLTWIYLWLIIIPVRLFFFFQDQKTQRELMS